MSPKNEKPYKRIELAGDEHRTRRFQEHWYRFISSFIKGLSVLDVGAGAGYQDVLAEGWPRCVKAIDPSPIGNNVSCETVENIESKSFDVVLAIDVIEHVEHDVAFLSELVSIAKRFVFLTTPNWDVSKCANIYHVREYTPIELVGLLTGRVFDAWTSDDACLIKPIESLTDASANFGILIHADHSL